MARPEDVAGHGSTAYDVAPLLAQVASATGTTREPAPAIGGELSSLRRRQVGANAGASALPRLTGSIAESFEDGTYATGTSKAGTEFYRAEGWGASALGRFLGTEGVSTRADLEPVYNIAKSGNPAQVMRTYRLTEDVTMDYGRVARGERYQALMPGGFDPVAVVRQVGARPLG